MREHKNFWDRNAGLYDCFMRKDRAVYEKMYELIRPVVKDKTVLEVATGTGLTAKHIVKAAAHIEGDGCLSGNDYRGQTGELLCEAAFFRAGYVFSAIREQIIRCGNRIKRTAHCASARKITARDQTGAEG